MPAKETMSEKGELQFIYDMIESGLSTAEILKAFPQAMRYLDKIDRARQLLIEDEYKKYMAGTYCYLYLRENRNW